VVGRQGQRGGLESGGFTSKPEGGFSSLVGLGPDLRCMSVRPVAEGLLQQGGAHRFGKAVRFGCHRSPRQALLGQPPAAGVAHAHRGRRPSSSTSGRCIEYTPAGGVVPEAGVFHRSGKTRRTPGSSRSPARTDPSRPASESTRWPPSSPPGQHRHERPRSFGAAGEAAGGDEHTLRFGAPPAGDSPTNAWERLHIRQRAAPGPAAHRSAEAMPVRSWAHAAGRSSCGEIGEGAGPPLRQFRSAGKSRCLELGQERFAEAGGWLSRSGMRRSTSRGLVAEMVRRGRRRRPESRRGGSAGRAVQLPGRRRRPGATFVQFHPRPCSQAAACDPPKPPPWRR